MRRFAVPLLAVLLGLATGCRMWFICGDPPPENDLVHNVIPGSFSTQQAINRMADQLLAYSSLHQWSRPQIGCDDSALTYAVWLKLAAALELVRGNSASEWQLSSRVEHTTWTLTLSRGGQAVRSWAAEVYDLP